MDGHKELKPKASGSSTKSVGGNSIKDKNANTKGSSVKSGSGKRKTSVREKIERERLVKLLEERREKLQNERRKEKQIMLGLASGALILGIFWLVAVGTDYWYFVYGNEANLSSSNSSKAKIFVKSNTGLWRVCRTVQANKTLENWCKSFSFMPKVEDVTRQDGSTLEVIDLMRTEVSFAILSLILMMFAAPVAFYTFTNSRYMFKRLAAGMYFFSGATVLGVIQVTDAKIRFEIENMEYIHPKDSTFYYGFCYFTGWVVLVYNFITAFLFLWYSRKRKGDKVLDEDDPDQVQIMGR